MGVGAFVTPFVRYLLVNLGSDAARTAAGRTSYLVREDRSIPPYMGRVPSFIGPRADRRQQGGPVVWTRRLSGVAQPAISSSRSRPLSSDLLRLSSGAWTLRGHGRHSLPLLRWLSGAS